MKTKIIIYCLLSAVICYYSCSSNTNQVSDNKSSDTSGMTVDTNLKGLTGVIEKNPPVVNGDFVSKYPNGLVKMKGYYINGKREGQWVSFFENGQKQSEGFFKNGLRDGKALVYYQNGQLYYEGYYNNGKEVGKWIFFDQQGKKLQEKDYDSKPNS